MELWYLISAHYLLMLYICTKFQENISKGFRIIQRMRFELKFSKGHYSVNNVRGAMVLVLSVLSYDVLYCTKYCQSIS